MDHARILVVEDEKIVALEIEDQLHRLGYEVLDMVTSGNDAYEKAAELLPDLILMDIKLRGDIDGIQAAIEIRKKYNIPVVFLTAYADETTIQRCKLSEPYGYLLKPFESKELHTVIEMALYRSTIEKKLKEHEQWLSITLKSINEAVIATDKKGKVNFMNPVAESITGWKEKDVVGNKLRDVFVLIDEKTGKSNIDPVKLTITKGESFRLQDYLMRTSKVGKKIPISGSIAPIRDEKTGITGVVVTFVDISERKRSEKINTALYGISKAIHATISLDELFHSIHESLSTIIDTTNFYVALVDKGKELITFPYFVDEKDVSAPSLNVKNSKSLTARVIQSGKVLFINREKVKDRSDSGEFEQFGSLPVVWLGVPLMINKDVIGVMVVQSYTDPNLYSEDDVELLESISEQVAIAIDRKRVVEDLRIKNSAMSSSTNAFLITDLKGVITYINQAFVKLWGFGSENEILGKSSEVLWPNKTKAKEFIKRLRQKGSFIGEVQAQKKDKSLFDVQLSANVVTDEAGNQICLMGSLVDITERKKSREEIKILKEFNESIIQNMSEGIVVRNAKGIITFVNPAVSELLGYSTKELVGHHLKTIIPPDQFSVIEEAHKMRLLGKSSRYEVELISKKGKRISVLISGSPRFEGRKYLGTVAVFTDITDVKRVELEVEKRQKYLESLLHDTPEAIVTMDASHLICEWNPGAEQIYGYKREEVIGKNIDNLITKPDVSEEATGLTKKALKGIKVEPFETIRYRKDGTPVNVIVAGSPIRVGGEFHGVVAVYTDITERKKSEEDLKRAKELAEEMNQELKLAIDCANRAAMDAEMANATKSEFLANMSHEIRTPMNGIIGMTELALETELTPVQREYLDDVKTSSESLLTIINDILDFSKIEAGRMEMDNIDFSLQDTLGDTMNTLAVKADKKGIELVCRIQSDVPDNLQGDPSRLRQILLNLLSNAVKFTNEGEVVLQVELERFCGKGLILHFTVTDTGIGIPKIKQNIIFNAFTQVDGSTTRKYGGTGLGLTITSNLVHLLEGQIWVESPVHSKKAKKGGPGSSFHFTVKLGLNKKSESKIEGEVYDILKDISVLVVDDNETHLSILEEMLSNWGMNPVSKSSSKEALAFLKQNAKPRANHFLVLMDVQMPEMDGIAFLKEIRKHPSWDIDTILMLSSWDCVIEEKIDDGESQAFIKKPIKQSDLLNTFIETLVKSGKISLDSINKKLVKPGKVQKEIKKVASMERALTILLAEDNAINQKLVITLLEKKGWDITPVHDGREAVEAWSTKSFDLILMDVQMPEMDGFEATKYIREKEAENGHHIPIIAMTAHAMKGDRGKCLESGMDDYISKPMKANELYATIARVMRNGEVNNSLSIPQSHIDLGQAMETVGGDKNLLKELIHLFIQEYPRQLEEINDVIELGDTSQLERKAHSFKGTVGNFGAKTAFDLAYKLENMGRESRIEKAEDVYKELKKEMVQVQEYLTSDSWEKLL
jgi:PAS domain S-box-containing protein